MRTNAPLTRGPVSLTRVAADRCRQNAGAELQSLVSEDPSVWTASGSHWQKSKAPDAAQRLDDRLAWHAGVGRLGYLVGSKTKRSVLMDRASERTVKSLLSRLQMMSKKEIELIAKG